MLEKFRIMILDVSGTITMSEAEKLLGMTFKKRSKYHPDHALAASMIYLINSIHGSPSAYEHTSMILRYIDQTDMVVETTYKSRKCPEEKRFLIHIFSETLDMSKHIGLVE